MDVDLIKVTSNIQEQNQGSNQAERELELDCLSTAHGTAVHLEGHGYHGFLAFPSRENDGSWCKQLFH